MLSQDYKLKAAAAQWPVLTERQGWFYHYKGRKFKTYNITWMLTNFDIKV